MRKNTMTKKQSALPSMIQSPTLLVLFGKGPPLTGHGLSPSFSWFSIIKGEMV